MGIGIAIVALYAFLAGVLIFKYEKPSKNRGKITGRGGDFES
ncbi:hypothetical protein MCEPAE42_00517 [Candidatus Nanopelagicaceae bacterium]